MTNPQHNETREKLDKFFTNQECQYKDADLTWKCNSLYLKGKLLAVIDRKTQSIVIDPEVHNSGDEIGLFYLANRRGFKVYRESLGD